jgi:short-subunit dehydrogenase
MRSNIVVVTGASSGIGEATAKLYGRAGACVLLLARNVERLEAVASSIRKEGGTAIPYSIDLADPRLVEEIATRITREEGTPRVVINNAGAGRWLPVLETSPEAALAMMKVPYLAAFSLTRAFLPQMLVRGSGAIACITSPASYLAWPNATAYIAARRALAGFAAGLRSEVKGSGVNVTLVVLGTVDSPYWEHNPGSREHLPATNPRLVPTLTCEEAAETIFTGVEEQRRTIVRPSIFRVLLALNALFPGLVASQLRRATRKSAADHA